MSDDQKLLPLPDAVERASGQRPHPSTLHRWRLRGIKGVKLETKRVGGRRMCSVDSVRLFLDAVTVATDGALPNSCTNRQRQADINRAEAELKKAGI